MSTNGGEVFLNKEGDVPDYGACYIDQKQMANIFGLFHMSMEHRITMDTDIENAFIVHFKDGRQVKFEATEEGLCVFKPPDTYVEEMWQANHSQSHVIATVEENQKGYTKPQCKGAKKARTLYHSLGCPTLENLKHILRQRIITNCPVTIEDVNIAADIYGPKAPFATPTSSAIYKKLKHQWLCPPMAAKHS